jgi:hypothetical protein
MTLKTTNDERLFHIRSGIHCNIDALFLTDKQQLAAFANYGKQQPIAF